MPSSCSLSSVTVGHQQPSPTKSDIVLSQHYEDMDGDITPAFTSVLTEGSETEEYEERTRTWPRKRSGHDLGRPGVNDSNDPARLADNPADRRNVNDRLASQLGCKSAETVFTIGPPTDETERYNVDPSYAAAAAAAELLGANPTVQRTGEGLVHYSDQYSINSRSTPSSSSIQQPFTNASVPYLCPYSSSPLSPYNDTHGRSSPAVAAKDGRHAVDMLFDHLSQNEPDTPSTAALRSFPISPPHPPAHSPLAPSPFYLSNDRHSSAADLSTTDRAHRATPPATGIQFHQR